MRCNSSDAASMRAFVVLAAISGLSARAAAPASEQPAATRPPSVLIILPDEWRAQALGCMGNVDVRTPCVDKLASEGLLCRTMFANTPVCCPARAVLMTGRYAHQNGMVANDLRLRDSETTIAEILAARGYRTGFIGKWHLDGGPRMPGFVPPGPRRQGFQFWAANECEHNHFHPSYFRDDPRPIVDNRFESEVWADRALEFLKSTGDAPFFLVVAPGPPHDPYAAPPKYMKMYDPDALSLRPNWVAGTPGGSRRDLAAYYAAITAVDEQVGRIVDALDAGGRRDDTIVVFTSDHGDMLGSHGSILKRKPWEESTRVPGIIRYPARIAAGRTSNALVSHVDLAPTLLALTDAPVPAAMSGSNLADVVLGRDDRGPDAVLFQILVPFDGDRTPLPWRGIRTKTHMYARTKDNAWVLYDLERDPYELHNLIDDPASAALRQKLDAQLAELMARRGDSWKYTWMDKVEDRGRLFRFETFETIEAYRDWARTHPNLAPRD